MTKSSILIFISLFIATQVSMAATINQRQDKQNARIVQGVASGELTARETRKLAKQQVHIANKEAQFKSDGVFTKKERAIIRNKQDNASAHIYKQKHDAQDRN